MSASAKAASPRSMIVTATTPKSDKPSKLAWMGKGLTQSARIKGGSKSKWRPDLQEIISWIGKQIRESEKVFTDSTLRSWLLENATREYEIPIIGLPSIWTDEKILYWMHGGATTNSISMRSLKPYVDRANSPD